MELSGLGQKGLWIGGTIALTYSIFCMHYILFGLSDWKQIAKEAHEEIDKNNLSNQKNETDSSQDSEEE